MNRIGQLNQLAANIPLQNQRIAAGLNAARQTNLQQAISQMAPEREGAGLAQQIGEQQAAAAGQIAQQAAAQTQQQVGQVGQLSIEQDKMQKQQELFTRKMSVEKKSRLLTNELAKLDTQIKDKLLDQQLSFKRDEFGRTLYNDRQLADLAVLKAKTQTDLEKFEQTMYQQSQRRMQILQAAQNKIKQSLEQGYMRKGQQMDQQTRLYLAQVANEARRKMERERARKAGRAAITQGIFTVAGMAIGGAVLGPMVGSAALGATLGGTAGGGLGSVAAGTGFDFGF